MSNELDLEEDYELELEDDHEKQNEETKEDLKEEEEESFDLNTVYSPEEDALPKKELKKYKKLKRKEKYADFSYSLLKSDNKYYKEVEVSPGDKCLIEQIPPPQEDFMREMYDKINSFDEETWTSSFGFKTGWKSLDNALLGLQAGFHVIAADSNLGKTSFMSQLEGQIIDNNDDAYVMSFTLDDPEKDKLARVIASSSRIPINTIKNPKTFKNDPAYQFYMARREMGLKRLKENVDKYKVFDSTITTDIEEIRQIVVEHKIKLSAMGSNKKIVVFIDNFHDITTKDPRANKSKNERYEAIAEYISDFADAEKIPIVCTAELKKIYGNARPTIDDIRETGKIKYEAKSVILGYQDVHYKGEQAGIFYTTSNKTAKQPVFEAHIAKNKYNDFKGRLFFEFFPDIAWFNESSDASTKQYINLLYSQ